MVDSRVECPKCGMEIGYDEEQIGSVLVCPSCGVRLELMAPEGEAPAGADAPNLPERMKANRLVEGRTCPVCGKDIFFGQDVRNCQTCGQTIHDACWEEGGCPTCTPTPLREPAGPRRPPSPPAADSPAEAAEAQEHKECRFCGETILAKARKCRYCGEFQDEAERQRAKANGAEAENDKLAVAEWVLAILCSAIGCIVAIVWICQGKKKGWKMLLVSIVANIILQTIVRLAKQ